MDDFWSNIPVVCSFKAHDYENLWSQQQHVNGHCELLYVLEGKFTLMLSSGLKFPAVAGDFLIIPSGIEHRDAFEPSTGLRILMMQFDWEGSEGFWTVVSNRTLCNLDLATRSEAMRRINFMYDQYEKSELGYRNVDVQLHALLMLFYVSARSENGPSSALKRSRPDIIQQMKFFIMQNYASEITLEKLAHRFEISPAYLSRLFHREYGVSFYRYLTTVRMEAAVSMLSNTSLQIAEVALRSGFSDSSYFIKIFRRNFGTTPKNYRRGVRPES